MPQCTCVYIFGMLKSKGLLLRWGPGGHSPRFRVGSVILKWGVNGISNSGLSAVVIFLSVLVPAKSIRCFQWNKLLHNFFLCKINIKKLGRIQYCQRGERGVTERKYEPRRQRPDLQLQTQAEGVSSYIKTSCSFARAHLFLMLMPGYKL